MPLTDPAPRSSDTDRTVEQLQKEFDFPLATVLDAITRLELPERQQQVLQAIARLSWTAEGQLQEHITVSYAVLAEAMSVCRTTAGKALWSTATSGYLDVVGKDEKGKPQTWRGVRCKLDRRRLFTDGHQHGDHAQHDGDHAGGNGDHRPSDGDHSPMVTTREMVTIQSRTPPIRAEIKDQLDQVIEELRQVKQQLAEQNDVIRELRECISRRRDGSPSETIEATQTMVTNGDQQGAQRSAAPFSLEKEKTSNQPTNQPSLVRGAASYQGDEVSQEQEGLARRTTWNVETIKSTLLQQLNLETGVGVDYAGMLFTSARQQGLVSFEDRDEFLALCLWLARQKWMTNPGGYLRLQIEKGKWRKKFTEQDAETVREFFVRVAARNRTVNQSQLQLSAKE